MQSLHYLTLAVLIPPFLAAFAESSSLEYEGGAANVGKLVPFMIVFCKGSLLSKQVC